MDGHQREDDEEGEEEEYDEEESGSEMEEEDVKEWFKPEHEEDSHFVYVNNNRKTIQAGDQVFYNYGKRSNYYLISNYGFAYADNQYDSYYVNLCMDINLKNPSVKTMVEFDDSDRTAVQARLKKD